MHCKFPPAPIVQQHIPPFPPNKGESYRKVEIYTATVIELLGKCEREKQAIIYGWPK